jgi:hypothetical protein
MGCLYSNRRLYRQAGNAGRTKKAMRRKHHKVCRHSGARGRIKPGNRQYGTHFGGKIQEKAFFCKFLKKVQHTVKTTRRE